MSEFPAIAKSHYKPTNAMPQPNTEGTPAAPSGHQPAVQEDGRGERREGHDPADAPPDTPASMAAPPNRSTTRPARPLRRSVPLQGPNLTTMTTRDKYARFFFFFFLQDWQQEDCTPPALQGQQLAAARRLSPS